MHLHVFHKTVQSVQRCNKATILKGCDDINCTGTCMIYMSTPYNTVVKLST